MSDAPNEINQDIKNKLNSFIISSSEFRGESTYFIEPANILNVLGVLKTDLGFTYLADLTAVDYFEVKSPRFEVVYLLHRFGENYEDNTRIRIKSTLADDNPTIDSATSLWKGADWLEREVYDMFGIIFNNHPDLRRIMMPEDYDEFPLRKDFDVRNREPSKRSFQKALKEGNF
ncbi:MAG: NADH-quinone oxidoreductase subunit C [Thermodesulfobacteriota bacterium]